ncbi:MAG: TIM barrel protein [Rhizobiales bacterium]|nr:TIM barrel protein [Hyphomicrobiales bacterium]
MSGIRNSRPILGAAVMLDDLDRVPGLREFLFERDRDVEIQDLIPVEAARGDGWREFSSRARAAFDGHRGRIGIHGPFWGFAIDTPDPDVRAIAQARLDVGLEALIAATRGRGGAHMVLHSPFTTWGWYNRGTKRQTRDETAECVHLCLAPAVRKAEDHGIVLVIENVEDKDPAERVALAASFASPAVKVSLDTGHAHYAHGATGAPPVDVFVRAAGDALAHVHLQDADGFADRHWAIGRGTILWPCVFAALGELAELPRLIVEMNDAADILPSARHLHEAGLAE